VIRSALIACLALPLLSALAGCSESAASRLDPGRQLVITGSSTIAPLIGDLAREYESRHANVRIDVQTGGSSRGIADTRQGLAEIGMVSRALGPAERDLEGYSLAVDGVALIVHASNPIEQLSAAQVVDVYTGRTVDWSELAGPGTARGLAGPISVVHKADGRSTQQVFLRHFALDPAAVKASVVIGDNEQGVKSVAGNPGAIGYVSIGAAEASIASGVPIRLVALDGVAATSAAVASASFPLVRELNLVTLGDATALASSFIAFARSPDAREFIEAHYFVALE